MTFSYLQQTLQKYDYRAVLIPTPSILAVVIVIIMITIIIIIMIIENIQKASGKF